ncbi:MAG: hypothetical protein KGJ23_13940 [Euryarchaeota archaeon]|nr:hypothetical protein [Euryarchaeota archaeon]MDE1837699.1 hypothetical protein [Euryarchaeota archaeon]MDE1881742.1 hypothetical protein [Euryarchaeota archaeon]MDE2045971.1 hypothetical protein [Thermoplasmata archaeon]
MSSAGATLSPHGSVRRPHPPASSPSTRAWLASTFQAKGRQVLFLGTETACRSAVADPRFLRSVPRFRQWTLRPLASVVRAAARGMGDLFSPGMDYSPVLGALCLPPGLLTLLLRTDQRGKHALILEGLPPVLDEDSEMGVRGIEMLANRTLTHFAEIAAPS